MIHYPAGRAYHDRCTALQAAYLLAVVGAAVNGEGLESSYAVAKAFHGFRHLDGQFTRWGQAERLRSTSLGIQICQNGQPEGSGLSCPRVGHAQQVASLQQVRNGFRLDGRGGLVPDCLDGFLHLNCQWQISKRKFVLVIRRITLFGANGFFVAHFSAPVLPATLTVVSQATP